jgi:pimeloyl-ACP methyl ester carboxylesterase
MLSTPGSGLPGRDRVLGRRVGADGAIMWPGISFHLAQLLPDVQLSIYPDSGYGGIFQHHDLFVAQALEFLRD